MKMYIKKALKNIAAYLLATVTAVAIFAPAFTRFSGKAENVDEKPLDSTKVSEDLKDYGDLAELFPADKDGELQLVNFTEYCYSSTTNADFGLYLYVYNPAQLVFTKGEVNMATAYEEGKPSSYENLDLKLCKHTDDHLLYKFRVVEKATVLYNNANYLERTSEKKERRYDIVGLQLAQKVGEEKIGLTLQETFDTLKTEDYDSLPLRIYKVCEEYTWDKLKWFVKDYAAYLAERKAWLWAFGIIWAYNLNAITIALEVLAYWFYFSQAFDFKNLLTLIAKVAMDLTVAIDFLPAYVWVIVTYLIFNHIRREIGFTALAINEASNEKFLEENPGNIFLTGPPRIGKTRIATSMGLTQEVLFRKKAQEKAFERHMEFPHFKWAVLENTLKAMRDRLPFYSLATLRVFIEHLSYDFKARAIYNPENYWFELDKLKSMGYPEDCEDFLFGYDYRRYGNEYNNGLKIVDIFETLLLYSEEYYIYTCPTSLIVGNYPVRTDIVFSDYGNYPLMDADFFHSDPRELKERSKMSKLLIYDMMRLQRKRDPNEPYQHNLEIGVIQITEAGKERGNQNTNASQKADASSANAKNDGLEMDAKIHSHGATIDFYTYFRIILDEQRATSLMADFRELASECKIKGKSPDRLVMPFFEVEEALYLAVGAFFKSKVYYFLRNVKGKDTLLLYLAHKLYKLVYDHRTRVWNQFGTIKVNLSLRSTVDGEGHEEKGKGAWILSFKKDNADRYDTGALGSYYHEKGLQSDHGGIYQIPVWSKLQPPMQEYRRLGGYLTDRMDETFGLGLIHEKHGEKAEKAMKTSQKGMSPKEARIFSSLIKTSMKKCEREK